MTLWMVFCNLNKGSLNLFWDIPLHTSNKNSSYSVIGNKFGPALISVGEGIVHRGKGRFHIEYSV